MSRSRTSSLPVGQNFKRGSGKNRTNANADKMAAVAKLTGREEDGAHAV